jgi:hypothetical protein
MPSRPIAGVPENEFAVVMLKMLIKPQTGHSLGENRRQRGFADFERIAAQVVAVQFDQIEGVEEHAGVIAPVTDAVEGCHAVVIAGDRFAVDDAGPRAQPRQGLDNERETVGQIIAGAAVEPHAVAILARNDAEAVVLDLVHPGIAARRLRRFGGQAGRDEAARQGHGR